MIKELIDQFYSEKDGERDKTHFYISDAGKCQRAIYFKFKNYPKKPMEARTLRILEHGDYTHARLMGALFSLGLVVASEIEIPNKESVHGRADAIISLDAKLYVLEIKSIKSYGFQQLEKPSFEHVCQAQLYMHFFKIAKAILIYENKDTQELKEFDIGYDEKFSQNLLKEFEELKKDMDKNIIPPKPQDMEEWKCSYCPYAEECAKIK